MPKLATILPHIPTLAVVAAAVATMAAERAGPPPSDSLVKDAPVLTRESYNYAPAIIRDGDTYHLYWCAGVAGDYVLHAQAQSLKGPWKGSTGGDYDQALAPTHVQTTFDGTHTCDPNVLKLGQRWYLYYGGLTEGNGGVTAIGVAASDDGVHFARLNGGAPIVTAAETNPDWRKANLVYGAGQPAAAYIAPWIYLSVTDTTGAGSNHVNGAGQFVLRSKDPSFATGVQEFVGPRWEDRTFGKHTAAYSILDATGIDWAYDRDTDTLITVTDRTRGRADILALDPKVFRTLATGAVPLDWQEGPGLLSASDKTVLPRPSCRTMNAAVFSAEGEPNLPNSWHSLHYSLARFTLSGLCARQAAATVNPAPARTPPARDGAAATAR